MLCDSIHSEKSWMVHIRCYVITQYQYLPCYFTAPHPTTDISSPTTGLILAHRLRSWPNIKTSLVKGFVLAGPCLADIILSCSGICIQYSTIQY